MFSAILIVIVPVLLVVVLFIFGFSWYLAANRLQPQKAGHTENPGDRGLAFEAAEVPSAGHTLRGWWLPAAKKSGGLVVLLHDWDEHAGQLLPTADFLTRAGFSVLAIDFRGHGNSDACEKVTIADLLADITHILQHARSNFAAEKVGLLGHGLGGTLALLYAARDDGVAAVVCSSAFADLPTWVSQNIQTRGLQRRIFKHLITKLWEIQSGVDIKASDPLDRVAEISAPILFIHGESDVVCDTDNANRLFERAAVSRTEKHLIPGKGHADLSDSPEYGLRVVTFFRKYLVEADL